MAELAGTWTLRNFNPTFVTGNETREENAFIAGALDLRLDRAADPLYAAGMAADPFYLVGTIGWPGNPPGVLDVKGRIDTRPGVEHQRFDFTATGRPQTETAGWKYDYNGHMGRNWAMPDGSRVDRHPTLVGSVIRAKPHASSGGRTSAAGEVFSFIAVKPQQADMPHSYDVTVEAFATTLKVRPLGQTDLFCRRPSSSSKPSSKLSRNGGAQFRPTLLPTVAIQ